MVEAALGLLLIAGPASAAEVSVTNAWIRALPARLPAGGYFTLKNLGKSDVALTGASSPSCGMLMLHRSTDANGMSSMGAPGGAIRGSGTEMIKLPPRSR